MVIGRYFPVAGIGTSMEKTGDESCGELNNSTVMNCDLIISGGFDWSGKGLSQIVTPFRRGLREIMVWPTVLWESIVPIESVKYSCDASGSLKVTHPAVP